MTAPQVESSDGMSVKSKRRLLPPVYMRPAQVAKALALADRLEQENQDPESDPAIAGKIIRALLRDHAADFSSRTDLDWLPATPTADDFRRHAKWVALHRSSIIRASAARDILQVPFREVDAVADCARAAFAMVPASDPGVSDRDAFRRALVICYVVTLLADRYDLSEALAAGLHALNERDRGFDEPMLRPRCEKNHNEPFQLQRLKLVSALAYGELIGMGVKRTGKNGNGADEQVARVFKKCTGRSVTGRAVRNWHGRSEQGDLADLQTLSEAMPFAGAFMLWLNGNHDAARRMVLRELKDRLAELVGGI
jgi:hypothetical protein